MKLETYLSELTAQLQCRGVGDEEIQRVIVRLKQRMA